MIAVLLVITSIATVLQFGRIAGLGSPLLSSASNVFVSLGFPLLRLVTALVIWAAARSEIAPGETREVVLRIAASHVDGWPEVDRDHVGAVSRRVVGMTAGAGTIASRAC